MKLGITINRFRVGWFTFLVSCHCLFAEAPSSDALLKFQKTQQQIQTVLSDAMASTVGVGDKGSGVIVSSTGLVLTAAHVSGDPNRRITCRLPNGKRVRARTLGKFDFMDAGMVQLEGEGPWPYSEIGPRRGIHAGDWCFALGHPGGFEKERGIVLRVGMVIHSKDGFTRTDCKLLRGDSGGPLFNLNGEVIGIHSRIGEPLDDNYHTPIDSFHKMWDTLLAGTVIEGPRRGQERGSLGVGVEAHEQGVLLTEIRPGSAAEQAGLQPNDVIQSIDGFDIEGTYDFRWAISKNRPGARINIEFTRGDQPEEVTVELGQSRGRRGRGGAR